MHIGHQVHERSRSSQEDYGYGFQGCQEGPDPGLQLGTSVVARNLGLVVALLAEQGCGRSTRLSLAPGGLLGGSDPAGSGPPGQLDILGSGDKGGVLSSEQQRAASWVRTATRIEDH
jgi:hypothetical protein